MITDALATQIAEIAKREQRVVRPVLTYVANAIKIGDREVPYSTVAGIDVLPVAPTLEKDPRPLSWIWLNEWAASDLDAKVGDGVDAKTGLPVYRL